MKDYDRLISRFRQFGGLQLVWEYAKLGVLGIAVKEFFRCIVKNRSFKSIYPKILAKIEPVLLNKYFKSVDKVDKVYKVSKVECEPTTRIWWCWLQGLDKAPELAKSCLESLKQLGTEIVIIDDNNYTEWVELPEHVVDKYKAGKMPAALFSDILRLALLIKYGGVWIDSTVLYTHTEGTDNTEKKYCPSWGKICSAELFLFRYTRPGEKWNGSIGNWFISARPNNPLFIELYEALCRYWKENDVTLDYYIFHLFFAELSKQYPDMIANLPYGFASACLQLRNNLGKRYSEEIWNKICSLSNFHKMSPRVSAETQSKRDNFYQYLIVRK